MPSDNLSSVFSAVEPLRVVLLALSQRLGMVFSGRGRGKCVLDCHKLKQDNTFPIINADSVKNSSQLLRKR